MLLLQASVVERADGYLTFLVQLVDGLVREMTNPQFAHNVFECLCVVIKKVIAFINYIGLTFNLQTFPYIQNTINTQLMPIIEQIIERDLTDFIPYALQIVAVLLYQVS